MWAIFDFLKLFFTNSYSIPIPIMLQIEIVKELFCFHGVDNKRMVM